MTTVNEEWGETIKALVALRAGEQAIVSTKAGRPMLVSIAF